MITAIPYPDDLPIVAQKEKIIKAIHAHQVVIVAGDTGSGKTTQLPKMCLEAGRGVKKLIGCTQPRRIAALTMAARLAEELGEAGYLVGSKIRFQDRTDQRTRIKFMTDGILLAEIQTDRWLSKYDTIIVDEAHERSLNIDFILGILKQLLDRRPDLKILITSATIDTEKFANHFNKAPVIQVAGRAFPVETRYLPPESIADDAEEVSHIDRAVQAVLDLRRHEKPGDMLLFMPTERDILETVDSLTKELGTLREAPLILPLFGRLPTADQQKIFRPQRTQKIVVATNVAETSITVPGIRYVVDTGLARISMYNSRARTMSLPVTPVSRASCDQRQGRCGRVAPGICVRLYSEEDYRNRPEYTQPEIRRADLAEVILRMLALNLGEPAAFPFIDPPAPRAIRDGYALLHELGALETAGGRRRLTARGRLMARLPLDPRISRLVIEAKERNALREVTIIAAALTIQDPRVRPAEKEVEAATAHARFSVAGSDFLSYLAIWDTFHQTLAKVKSRARLRKFCLTHYLSYQRMREWQDIHEQLNSILAEEGDFPINTVPATQAAIHQAILSGFLRNIGMKKAKNLYQGAQGKELVIFPGSNQFNRAGAWIMAAELVETSRLYARTVADIRVEWLEPLAGSLCRSSYSAPRWEKKRGQVVADEKVALFGLVIVAGRKASYSRISPAARREAKEIFIQTALLEGELGGRYDFLDHNHELLTRLSEMEEKLRQRGFLADDQTLFRFYDERLGDVCDRAELNRLLKAQGSDDFLKMTEADLVEQPPAAARLLEFPETIRAGQFSLELVYRFTPGIEDDGVTAIVPLELLGQLCPEPFDWLVPGLLPDKITCLLKGLPKTIRKQLIPVQHTARELAAQLHPDQGFPSLYQALEQAVLRRFGLRVPRAQWLTTELPPHLRMRFQVIDGQGNLLMTTRNFAELNSLVASQPQQPVIDETTAAIRQRWERDNITAWDFDELPTRIPLTNANGDLCGFAFPALVVEEQTKVALRLFTNPEEGRLACRQALPQLYRNYFPQQFPILKKSCQSLLADKTAGWLLHEGLAGREQLLEEAFRFILEEIFACRTGLLPDRTTFFSKIDDVKTRGLLAAGNAILAEIRTILAERRETLAMIDRFAAINGAAGRARSRDLKQQVTRILPGDFLQTFDRERLAATGRYFKALRIRAERAHVAPDKDLAKAAQLAPFLARLEQWQPVDPAPECCQMVEEYRRLVEEFAVSLFAPEVKTAVPVSAKRLDKKWQELRDHCI